MKKQFIAAALAGTLLLSGCSGVSQESYNSVVAENEQLKSENSSLKSANTSLSEQNKENESFIETQKQEISDLNKKIQQQNDKSMETSEPIVPKYTKVYSDNFVTVSFCGIEKSAEWSNRESVTFLVENKTNVALTFCPVCVSLDKIDVGKLMNYDSISPQSKGKIYFPKEYDSENPNFDNKTPSIVSGTLLVVDENNTGTLGESRQYEFSFANVEIQQ